MRFKYAILMFFIALAFASANENERRVMTPHALTFAQAADLAVAASVDLRHSLASQSLMEKTWAWGARAYFPQFGINISENDRLQQIGADSFMKNYGLSLDQLIWDGGKISMSRKLEKMELNLSSKKLDRMADTIAESAISAYRSVLSSRAVLKIKKDALSILQEQRKILNEEVMLGLALAVDLSSADISIADAKIDIFSLEIDLEEMEKQFLEILGIDYMPILAEKVDIYRAGAFSSGTAAFPSGTSAFFSANAAAALAKEQNPDLIEARYSVTKKQMELKYISNSWIPSLRLTGNFSLSGQQYPLTRYNWSVGISVDFTSPWLQNRFAGQTGWEPSSDGKNDRTALIQTSLTPLPDPASRFNKDQAKLALALEQEKYQTIYERIGRTAAVALEKCGFAEQKRILALEAVSLGAERCKVEEIKLKLGHITRLKLMEFLIEQTQREIAAVDAATALLEAERELERFLDLKPGEIFNFANSINTPTQTRRN